jgi:superfamily II DNA helicase RecQ
MMIEAMKSTMRDLFNIQPNHFQQRIIPHILMMMKGTISAQLMILVQSTGGGKSAVPQTCGCTKAGVTIVLENTLALGADQCSKLDQLQSPNIITYQLDHMKPRAEQTKFIEGMKLYLDPANSNRTKLISIFIFSSPEKIVSSTWLPSIKSIINANPLNLFCINEVHQFIEFGTTFREEF